MGVLTDSLLTRSRVPKRILQGRRRTLRNTSRRRAANTAVRRLSVGSVLVTGTAAVDRG